MAVVNRPSFDLDQRLVPAVDRVEMSRRMVTIIQSDDDAVKPADLRHGMVRGWLLYLRFRDKSRLGKFRSPQTRRSGRIRRCARCGKMPRPQEARRLHTRLRL